MRVDSINALKTVSIPGSVGDQIAQLTGYNVPGDGGGGTFYWAASITGLDNGGTIIQSTAASGSWIRIYSGPINVRWFGALGNGTTDDTAAINKALSAATSGEVIFGYGGTYVATGSLNLNYPVTVNLNNCTIQFNAPTTTNAGAFAVASDNVTIRNGTINGTFLPGSVPSSPGLGPNGIRNPSGKSNLRVDSVTIQNLHNSGILAPGGPFLRVLNSSVINTGYISLFCQSSLATVDAGMIRGSIFDRSAIPPGNIVQPVISVRGNASPDIVNNLIFSGNKVVTAVSPAQHSAACMEARLTVNSVLNNNVYVSGAIGLSIVGSHHVAATGNICNGGILGLEIASGSYTVLTASIADGNSQANTIGMMIDGYSVGTVPGIPATYNTASSNNVVNVTSSAVQIYRGSSNNNLIGGVLTEASGTAGINILGAQSNLISGVLVNGNTSLSHAVVLDNSSITVDPSLIVNGTLINACQFVDLGSSAIQIYAPNGGTIAGLRFTNNSTTSSTMLTPLLTGATISSPYYYGNSPEIIGSRIILASGANASVGSSVLSGGTVTVNNTLVTANSMILLSVILPGGARGDLSYAISPGSNFIITSTAAESSTVTWMIIN
ncbi:MAG: glycosyl hydrolase family 28-related protein [Mucilaginibacter sp.]